MSGHTETIDLPGSSVEAARAALRDEASGWGGELDAAAASLVLPCQAGLRRGFLRVGVAVDRLGADGARIELAEIDSDLAVHIPSALLLLAGAGGGLAIVVWPFLPWLSGAMPLAFLLAFGAWFVVASRLGNIGLEDFAAALRRRSEIVPDAE